MNQRVALLQVVFHILTLTGCTLLSTHFEPGSTRPGDQLALGLIPLILGVGGTAYLAIVKKHRDSWRYGIPTIVFGVVISVFFPSFFSRIVVLILFLLLIGVTALKTQRTPVRA